MCGIAGQVWHDSTRSVDSVLLRRMSGVLRHRGPDDEGLWIGEGVGLAHRRLSIIDLSPRGHQPLANEDGSVQVVFNGEIYGFESIRDQLIARGHTFHSESDTEILVHLWEDEGPAMVARLTGMFAFAIWDTRSRTLFAARDRLGKKPFFYRFDERGLAFASEPRALFVDRQVRAEADPHALGDYLTFGYVPGAASAFKGLHKLPPAHTLLLHDSKLTVERYWSIHYRPKLVRPAAELLEELDNLIDDAVRIRMRSDVPLGALLSGGIDSSLVVAHMVRAGMGRIRTFSIGFEEQAYDESPHAAAVARHLGTEHHELIVRPDAAAMLPRIVWHHGEPFADSSALPTFLLAEMTRNSVTVALGGDGGDESFAGYDRYLMARVAGLVDILPRGLRAAVARVAAGLVPQGAAPKSLPYRARRFLEVLARSPVRRYAAWIAFFDAEAKQDLCTPEFLESLGGRDSLDQLDALVAASDGSNLVERLQHADAAMYLPDDLLVKVDNASMAHSLEVRSPLLDHRIVEFAAALPSGMKLHWLTKKLALRKLLRGVLPDAIIDRPKMGFGVPIDHWLRHELRDFAYDTLLSAQALGRGYYRGERVRQMLDRHVSNEKADHYRIWNLLMLELWHREFIDGEVSLEPPGGWLR